MTVENAEISAPQIESAAPPVENAIIGGDTGEPSEDDAMGAVFDRLTKQGGPERGHDGKFTAKQGDGADDGAGEASLEGEEGAGEGAPGSTAGDAAPAPAHMPQAIKDEWANMTPKAREALATYQGEIDRKFGEMGRFLGENKPIIDRLSTARQQMPELFDGMTPEQLAQGALELGAVQVNLNRDPVGTILQIAQTYGVLGGVAQALSGQQPTPDQHLVQGLQREIASLKGQLQSLGDPAAINKHVEAMMAQKDAERIIDDFAKSKPHYTDIEASLPAFIDIALKSKPSAPLRDVLEAAYDMAVNAIPEVREKVAASEAKATVAKPDPKRTEAARKAASINVKSTSTGKERPMSEEEAMAAAYDRMMTS
ncbi:hypothetical protein [Brucella sp. IR073]|uniref:hypothetical protein n=1 Tax=unclassified Brucella TaxID=2632610 RepID=UPI003B98600A